MSRKMIFLLFFLILMIGFPFKQILFAHCQIPCGIYDDPMRFNMIAEHITTIEKSMNQIMELSKSNPVNYNQIVRWVNNKEKHADELSEIITYYFLAQRIKPVSVEEGDPYKSYLQKLEMLHLLLVNTMKTKQSTDLSIITALRDLSTRFQKAYTQ
jgi:nickel superoxide dismutase